MFESYNKDNLESIYNKIKASGTAEDSIVSKILVYNLEIILKTIKNKGLLNTDIGGDINTGITVEQWLLLSYAAVSVDRSSPITAIELFIEQIKSMQIYKNGEYSYIIDNFFKINDIQYQAINSSLQEFIQNLYGVYNNTVYHYNLETVHADR